MQNNRKRDLILDAMQQLMHDVNIQTISVSDIAKEAGIGKGSIYYYFKSKEEILEAVIERSYSEAIEKSKKLLSEERLDALTKMEIIFRTCRDSSLELTRQETDNYLELQQSALIHQQYIRMMLKHLRPILSDVIRQGNLEGSMNCRSPEEISEIVLIILTIKMDNHLTGDNQKQIQKTLDVFTYMLETSFQIERGKARLPVADLTRPLVPEWIVCYTHNL